ncbi:phosphatidylserine/phosphatidylglycerophosphate/cardiolipin synthase family protein [uncultured Erythrobacter sp.]|uniref:phospholipase D-like domain-containing protein n=1 Tax=uncultured Erythrobacter sp. TaxID=263913 RepID=UPI00262A85EC|nr:phosphatidylserine/phosphatidylglycerophosphate/cardiolipin synthase family protein [uncultured Erythrobacter sp.]
MTDNNAPNPSATPTSDYRDADSFQIEAQGHAFTFYPSGSDRLEALLDHIRKAESSVHTFYYRFQDDVAGTKVRDALVEAADRGAEVSLIIDHFGSDTPLSFFNPILEAGGKFALFSPKWNVRYLVRNHQKFVIVDDARVMTGGANVSDQYFNGPEDNGWCDLGLAIEGPVVSRFSEWFGIITEWIESDGSQFRKLRRMIRDWDPGDGPVQLLLGGPSIRTRHWALELKKDLVHASRFDQISAYFTPPRSIQRLVRNVAQRGEVRLITAGKSDIDATIAAARLLYRPLLKAGAKIAEFLPCKLHMKLLVVDDTSYFGSANMDKRSIRINVELMIRVEDAALAKRLREFLDHLEAASRPVTPEWYAKQATLPARLRWRGAYALAIADYWLTRKLTR